MQPFRRAVLRGLAVVLPPLLTIVILLWIGSTVQQYVLEPVENASRHALVWSMNGTRQEFPPTATVVTTLPGEARKMQFDDETYVALGNGQWIPEHIRNAVIQDPGEPPPTTGRQFYYRYVDKEILIPEVVIPVFLAGFILLMYLLGKFLAAGIGHFAWHSMERVITRVPIIRTVYSSVKQVTDFFLSESEIEFTRVVAVEYPRRGMWSVGFVTGEGMATLRTAAQEPVVTVLMPTSPIPGTGFTVTVKKSETVDLDIPIDQALQFVVSCGVVVPELESQAIRDKIAKAAEGRSPAAGIIATQGP
jgi:uncharacterized membrane protein